MFIHRLKSNSSRGQTAIEYAMMLVIVMIPLAMAVRTILGPTENSNSISNQKAKPKNGMQKIVLDSYGNEKRMGTIGRPYP